MDEVGGVLVAASRDFLDLSTMLASASHGRRRAVSFKLWAGSGLGWQDDVLPPIEDAVDAVDSVVCSFVWWRLKYSKQVLIEHTLSRNLMSAILGAWPCRQPITIGANQDNKIVLQAMQTLSQSFAKLLSAVSGLSVGDVDGTFWFCRFLKPVSKTWINTSLAGSGYARPSLWDWEPGRRCCGLSLKMS